MIENFPIHFILESRIEGVPFKSHLSNGIDFKPDSDCDLRLVLRPEKSEQSNPLLTVLICQALMTYSATRAQAEFVEALNNRNIMLRVANNVSLPLKNRSEELIAEGGVIRKGFSPRRYLCPKDVVEMIEFVEMTLKTAADRFIKLLRWRQNVDALEKPNLSWNLFWKTGDGDGYPLAPLRGGPSEMITVNSRKGIRWGEVHENALHELWANDDLTEPLGHALVREAVALASEAPKSSILIMTAAIETGLKMHISKIAPDTAWLMEKIPSPPAVKILREYIPIIHKRAGREVDYWIKIKPFINKLDKLIEVRNKVAHSGKIPDEAAPIKESLILVADLLYLLDVLDGHEWAKAFPSYEFRKALGWPDPDYKEITFKVSISH